MRKSTDLASLAACLGGLSGMAEEVGGAHLALPFLANLRSPSYYYSLHKQPPAVLVELLHQFGKLRPWGLMDHSGRVALRQVLSRVITQIRLNASLLSAEDATLVTRALVRLDGRSRLPLPEVYLLNDLARHVASVLVPTGSVSPEAAVRLLWAYVREPRPAALSDAGSTSRSDARATKRPTGQPADSGNARHAELVAVIREDVSLLAAALAPLACRALDSLAPLELVKLVEGLARLGSRREAEAVLPQAVPPLLRCLAELDNSALADVAEAYHTAASKELGLLGAVADQVLARQAPILPRDISILVSCYGARGSLKHTGLWAVLRAALRESLRDIYAPALPKVFAALDAKDPDDSELIPVVRARMKELAQLRLAQQERLDVDP
ncbi:hypothetical protein GPECTOR_38g324 [Gonium pectorale]|uniref:Uncharacterized protein n=1 Tax=Gonium pectorale TaxID=33097 RepID=A0A150GB52_GONPE|nr:hypothetical protein GPECTOR_38g324 [Gonium pectorale]|eukprot:KXZ47087.1 hypothetical protein GPECTOR_38g324 [Gonium pectorale]